MNENIHAESTKQNAPEQVGIVGAGEVDVPNTSNTVTEPELGRGCREKRPSVRLHDYVNYNARRLTEEQPHHDLSALIPESESLSTVRGTPYPLTNYISDDKFSPAHKAFLASITSMREPRNFKEAMEQEIWRDSMKKRDHCL